MEDLRKKLNEYSKDEIINMLLVYKLKHNRVKQGKVVYNKMYSKTKNGKEALKRANKKYYLANKEKILAKNRATRERKKKEQIMKENLKKEAKEVKEEVKVNNTTD